MRDLIKLEDLLNGHGRGGGLLIPYAHPAAHGMIDNIWFDRATGTKTYNIEDPDYRLLTKGADVDAATEIDLAALEN